uniref:Uncharacterized protein n=2 Tax=Canis lupus familiaris TaxID=9615 RepID=A0A8I3N3N8_CANLF
MVLWRQILIILLVAAYLRLSVSLTHQNRGKETLLESLFVHLEVLKQGIHLVTPLLNQDH